MVRRLDDPNDGDYYLLRDVWGCAFLIFKGIEPAGTSVDFQGRVSFMFDKSANLFECLDQFYAGATAPITQFRVPMRRARKLLSQALDGRMSASQRPRHELQNGR